MNLVLPIFSVNLFTFNHCENLGISKYQSSSCLECFIYIYNNNRTDV